MSDVFAAMGLRPELERASWLPIAGIRLRRASDPYPVDVFASLDHRYDEVESRCVSHAFGQGDSVLPFLSART